MCDLKIAYFSHLSVLRKKNVKTGIFVRFRIPLSLSFFPTGTVRYTHFSFFFLSVFVALVHSSPFFSAKESGTNWLTSTQMASAWTDRGVTVLSAARLCGGSRGDRGESPKISRSRTTAVYRPTKYDLYAIAVHWIAHRAISEYLIIHRLQASSHLVSRV